MYKVMAQQNQTINQVVASNQKNLEAVKASGNAKGQGRGATSAQIKKPQPTQGASVNGPFTETQRPRSFSEAVSGNLAARQTVRQSIVQQASTAAQITAMSDEKWREAMNKAFGMTSASPTQAESRSRSQSMSSMEQSPNGGQLSQEN